MSAGMTPREGNAMNGVATVEQLWVTEDWELARQALVEAPELDEVRREIEREFQIDLNNLEFIDDFPDAKLKRLKERLLIEIESFVSGFKASLVRQVCIHWDYCNQKNSRKSEIAQYLTAALDIVLTQGALTLAVLLMKREYFDKLCGCKS